MHSTLSVTSQPGDVSAFAPSATITASASYTLQLLDTTHLPAMIRLQQVILDDLPPAEQNYIVPKSPAHFQKFLSAPYAAIGVFKDAQLVAQTMVAFVTPADPDKNLTLCDAALDLIHQDQNYGVLEGVLVDPSCRKQGLMKKMIAQGLHILDTQHQCQTVYAEVVDGNTGSYLGFCHSDFMIVRNGIDPADGCPLLYMKHRPPAAAGPAS